ncbi:riboflavin synthase [Paraferrimonas sedimenticola]|uniref:Riboflavin synthase n=1 Tax=Paraferrimonas sedimenticola TaxID=375674 RepID=A0AA37W1V3_9GAMM|nr:riboflavin synthase [Paraferrimonas sedimenticola]GLP96882.1 riboflavin synthase subunit alpha [Paraferrimonas sedimenticola]
MFTGIIEAVGHIESIAQSDKGLALKVNSGKLPLEGTGLGDSIATNGVCLTVTELFANGYTAYVSAETVALTGFAHYKVGQKVNLERAVTPNTRLGGHMVSGHVDGMAKCVERNALGEAIEFWIEPPAELARYIPHKGSVTIDGVSLTVNQLDGARFRLTIVPHTALETTLVDLQVGDSINLEVDLIARYLERLMQGRSAEGNASQGVTMAQLAKAGFA